MKKIDTWVIGGIRYATVKDFAVYTERSRQTVYNWIYKGMPAIESEERRFLILLDEAIEWVKIRGFVK